MAETIGHFAPHQKDQVIDIMLSVARSNLQSNDFPRAAETASKIVDADIAMTRADVLDVYIEGAYMTGQVSSTDGVVFAAMNGIKDLVKDEGDVNAEARSYLYLGGTPETGRIIKAMVGAHESQEVPPPHSDKAENIISDRMTRSKTNMGFELYERRTIYDAGPGKKGIRKSTIEAVIPPWPAQAQIKKAA